MSVIYRPARVQDLEQAGELVVRSMNDLSERHGFGPIAVVRPPTFAMFSFGDDPHGLWVAEEAGEIRGFAFSWVCDDLWFLAQLFVSPGRQGSGIGRELFKLTFEHARRANAATKALITFSFNSVSQGLYIRHGLFPRCPIYNLKVERERLLGRLNGAHLDYVPIENRASHLHSLADIDARALGVSRTKHHRYLLEDGTTQGVLLHDRGDCVGYVYVAEGHVGPLAVTHRTTLGAAFRTGLKLAAESGSPHVSAFLPGPCDAALSMAIEIGMRITSPMVLMSTRDFGNWTQYLPRNPGFM